MLFPTKDSNNLKGTIPSEISKLISLQKIDFTRNVLNGTLPSELFSLPLLLYFDVSYNSLIGQCFPNESFKAVSQLEDLFLESNNFGSTIPKEIGKLKMLQYLDIGNNNLSGSTPAEMANLNKLKYLNLEKNNLNGTIGEYLFLFPDFDFLYLSNNAFSGTIPSWNGSKLSDIWLDNNELKGRIPSGNLPKIGKISSIVAIQFEKIMCAFIHLPLSCNEIFCLFVCITNLIFRGIVDSKKFTNRACA